MTPSSRSRLLDQLKKLRAASDREKLPLQVWTELVGSAIREACPADSQLVRRLKILENKIEKDTGVDYAIESEYRQLMGEAELFLEHLPVETPDTSLEREVEYILKESFFKSWQFRSLLAAIATVLLGVFGGTVFYGTEIKGFLEAKNEALQQLQNVGMEARESFEGQVAKAYVEAKEKMLAHLETYKVDLQDGVANFNDEVGGVLGDITKQKETVLTALRTAQGDEKTGALGDITKQKETVLTALRTAQGDEKTGALGALAQSKQTILANIERLNEQTGREVNQFLGKLPSRVADLETRLATLTTKNAKTESSLNQISGRFLFLDEISGKIQESHKILKEGTNGVDPSDVIMLLNYSFGSLVAMVLCILTSLGISIYALMKAKRHA